MKVNLYKELLRALRGTFAVQQQAVQQLQARVPFDMNKIVFFAALLAFSLAEDRAEHNKRGVAKTSPLNTIPSNAHQKPEQLNYHQQTYQQAGATQSPPYPLAPPSYTQEQQQPVTHQPMFGFLPQQQQMIPLPLIAQQFAQPKYQLIAMKSANGQTHLTLIPQGLVFNPQSYAQPSYLQIPSGLTQNYHAAPQTSVPTQASTAQTTHAQPTYSTQSNAQLQYVQQPVYQQPQYNFGQNPILGQPSTMFIFGQPAPQLYNNYLSPQSSLYSPVAQQLLSYYQSNPQAKNQLLYGNSAYQQQGQVNSYQSPVSSNEYEKATAGQTQQSLTSTKVENELNLNTNEYINSSESQFRPVPSYGSRGHTTYKN